MNTYKASALSAKGRRAILDEAEKDGVIILRCNTNGDTLGEMVMIDKAQIVELLEDNMFCGNGRNNDEVIDMLKNIRGY